MTGPTDVTELGFRPFDCDNHYYEAADAFTRHVDARMHGRCVQWAEIDGRKRHVIGGQVSYAVANPTWDPIAKPGAMHGYFKGALGGKNPLEMLRDREPMPAEYMDRNARLQRLDAQGLEAVWLFPTLGVLYEELIKTDLAAVQALFHGFNRWLEDDWGCNYHGRIFAAPYIALGDVNFAVAELEWALASGARVVVMRPAAVWTADGYRSPGDEMFDPFWARVNEAGITVVIHASDSGHSTHGYTRDGFSSVGGGGRPGPNIKAYNIERAAQDWLLTMAFERMFERFPNLRIASIENGSTFLGDLFRKLDLTSRRNLGWFNEDPVESFKNHVWINPFWEDDVSEIVAHMGPAHTIFGSDWPHIEGLPQPLDYLDEIADFDAADQRLIMRDNTRALNQLEPL